MAFDWLDRFHHEMEKPEGYSEKVLTAYKLGMNAKGSIVGVNLIAGKGCPDTAAHYPVDKIMHPDDAPRVPIESCGPVCECVFRPVMAYQVDPEEAARLKQMAVDRKAAERASRHRPKS